MWSQHSQKILSLALGILIITVGCTDDPTSVNDSPPALPEASTMEMDFSNFESQQTSNTIVQSSEHFARAVITAAVLKTVVDFNLILPKALLSAAQNADAERNDDGTWEWSYSQTTNGNSFGVRLVAERDSEDSVDWNCYVTSPEQGVDDQLFFSGTTSNEGQQGVWTYYDLQHNSSEEAVSEIDWNINDEETSLRLEVISDRNGFAGDYIEYNFDGTFKTAVYYASDEDEETEIQINTDTKAGYIIAPNYNDGQQSCWDESLQNVVCE